MNRLPAIIIMILIISTNITYASFPLEENTNNEILTNIFHEMNNPDCIMEWILKILKIFLSTLVFYLVVFSPIYYYTVGNMGFPTKVRRKFLFRNAIFLLIALLLLLVI